MPELRSDLQDPSDVIGKILESKPASPREVFLYEWWEDSQKRNIPLLNDVLRSLLTLSAALSGSSMIFLSQVDGRLRVAASVFFLCAMMVSLHGLLPIAGKVSGYRPAEIAAHKERAQRLKTLQARLAASFIFGGLVTIALSLFWK